MSTKKTHKEFVEQMAQKYPDITVLGQYVNSKTKVSVKHSCGHTWEATPNDLLRGKGCPECAGNQRKTHEEFIAEVSPIHPDIQILGRYINTATKIKVQHSCGHVWKATPNSLLKGTGCSVCSHKKTAIKQTKDPKKFVEQMAQKHPDITVLGQYANTYTKIQIQHTCGYIWHATPAHLLQGKGCPKCGGTQKKTHEEFIELMLQKHPDIQILGRYINTATKIKIQHSCGHTWKAKPHTLLRGQGCPKCGGTQKKTHEEFIELMLQKHPDIKLLNQYQGDRIKIKVQHSCGHTWEVTPNNLLHKSSCPECAKCSFHKNKPATFYVYEIILDKNTYYGFGISNVYEKREKTHLKNLTEAGANISEKWLYPFESGYECKGLEDDLKAILKEACLDHNLGVTGFLTECAKEQALSLIMSHIDRTACHPIHATL